ncbi:MAG: hypothetical protein R3C12_21375 [Planctomycetaceae bacterium]|nr:hypothetical protein [Planctomycetaceae bacterium]
MNELNPDQIHAIHQALLEGQQIQAIKLYRDATGAGLRESKEFIDALLPQLKEQHPEQFAKHSGTGCALLGLLATLLTGGLFMALTLVLFGSV